MRKNAPIHSSSVAGIGSLFGGLMLLMGITATALYLKSYNDKNQLIDNFNKKIQAKAK